MAFGVVAQFATSTGRPDGEYLTFEVAPELVDQVREWSSPVCFKFEKHGDGTVTMWLQSVEIGDG